MTDASPPHVAPSQGPVFLDLGERLRLRGQLEAAESVARAGLAHFPALTEAHDLLARILADAGREVEAEAAWTNALGCTPGHVGALKGLAYLAFRRHDLEAAQDRLEAAAAALPHDTAILAALDRVRALRPEASLGTHATFGSPAAGMLLFDAAGLRVAGHADEAGSNAIADAAAAEAAGVTMEAARTARILGLGPWREVIVEGETARLIVVPLDDATGLLVRRPPTTPAGRLRTLAARGLAGARAWLAGDEA